MCVVCGRGNIEEPQISFPALNGRLSTTGCQRVLRSCVEGVDKSVNMKPLEALEHVKY